MSTRTTLDCLRRAMNANHAASQALEKFHQACKAQDWDRAEAARRVVLDSQEVAMDEYAAAHRG